MTIYVSDLDGTLLDRAALLPASSRDALASLIDRGMAFTVATGRTPASAVRLMSGVGITLPMILMNGALIIDPADCSPLYVEALSPDAASALSDAEEQTGASGFFIAGGLDGVRLHYGHDIRQTVEGAFGTLDPSGIDGSVEHTPTARARSLVDVGMICAEYEDSEPDRLSQMAKMLADVPGVSVDFYRDKYSPRKWCMEVSSDRATKGAGIRRLRELTGADEIVAFGDGANDLSMFEASDAGYAVADACAELKAVASGVIGPSCELGVVRFLEGVM